jgi:hypothetical protein
MHALSTPLAQTPVQAVRQSIKQARKLGYKVSITKSKALN